MKYKKTLLEEGIQIRNIVEPTIEALYVLNKFLHVMLKCLCIETIKDKFLKG